MERILKSKYKILEKISESSSHVTYGGAYVDTNAPLVIKIYRREFLNNHLIKQLAKDAALLCRLEGPGIPRLIDGDYGWQGFYFIREFVDGRPLEEFQKPVEPDAACSVLLKICDILADAHSKGFVHGSLTPGNIFVCGKSNIKIADFGIRAAVTGPLDLRASALFSSDSQYMPPEAILGDGLSPSSDIYQAGLILYLLLTGRLPTSGGSAIAGAIDKVTRQLPPPSSFNNKVPGYLDEIVLRCLERDPLLRFPDIKSFRESLSSKTAADDKRDLVEAPAISYKEPEVKETPKKREEAPAAIPQRARAIERPVHRNFTPEVPKSDKINIFKWIMFAVWIAIISGIIYSLVNILVLGE